MIGWPVWLIGAASIGQITFDRLEAAEAGWLAAASWGAGVAGAGGLTFALLLGFGLDGISGLVAFVPLTIAAAAAGSIVGLPA